MQKRREVLFSCARLNFVLVNGAPMTLMPEWCGLKRALRMKFRRTVNVRAGRFADVGGVRVRHSPPNGRYSKTMRDPQQARRRYPAPVKIPSQHRA